ncbi:MAG: MotA/TolQ/ExbB proton channel family protein [Thermodesulfobacteriota bacterium]
MFEDLTLFQLLQKGGYVMILLGGFSILSIGVMLERAWSFSRFGRAMREFPVEFTRIFKSGGVDEASRLCDGHASPPANVFRAGLAVLQQGAEEMAERMELSARREIAELERYLGVLGTIGNTAPFVGLFGTVIGIIRAFNDLAGAEGAGPSVVADGIAEALVATAAGLFVAVPAVIAYNYFTRRVARYSLELEMRSKEIVTTLTSQGEE